MGRGRDFSLAEMELIIDNYDLTIAELETLFLESGYNRSRKSINRKLEKLRSDGEIGLRSRDTIKRSYRQRTRRNKRLTPSELDDDSSLIGDGWEDNGGSLDTGIDWGEDSGLK